MFYWKQKLLTKHEMNVSKWPYEQQWDAKRRLKKKQHCLEFSQLHILKRMQELSRKFAIYKSTRSFPGLALTLSAGLWRVTEKHWQRGQGCSARSPLRGCLLPPHPGLRATARWTPLPPPQAVVPVPAAHPLPPDQARRPRTSGASPARD